MTRRTFQVKVTIDGVKQPDETCTAEINTKHGSHRAAGPYTPRNGRAVSRSNCGIATCLNRATDAFCGASHPELLLRRPLRPPHQRLECLCAGARRLPSGARTVWMK